MERFRALKLGTALAVSLGLCLPAGAHDLWVLPGKFQLGTGEVTRVFVNNGDVFPESLTLTGEHRLDEVALYGPDGAEPRSVTAFRVEGRSLTFDLSAGAPGTLTLGVALKPRRVRLRASDFQDYLSLEKLTAVEALRETLDEKGEAVIERYSKWAKAIVKVSDPATGESGASDLGWSEPVGHRIEIVPLGDPSQLSAGQTMGFRVLFEGEPVAGVPIVAGRAGGAARAVETETGSDGTAQLPLASSGRWYVRALHMVRREEDPEVSWESFWCTLTFEVAP